jgi:ABC-type ATPase involved in cell division
MTLPENAPALKAQSRDLDFYYGDFKALKSITMPVYENKVTALIGPSGCGKSTYLRCFNRMHDLYPGHRYDGRIELHPDNVDLLDASVDPIEVRMRISMVFQKPNPFPKSIFENVAYGLRVRGEKSASYLEDKVEAALKGAAIWNEVKNRLDELAVNLSGGQQQRLCIARASDRPGDRAVRRAHVGAGPHRHRRDRGTHHRDQEQGNGAHRHAQHAAGGTGVRLRRLHVPGRADRIWRHEGHLHEAPPPGNRRLHHRKVRVTP